MILFERISATSLLNHAWSGTPHYKSILRVKTTIDWRIRAGKSGLQKASITNAILTVRNCTPTANSYRYIFPQTTNLVLQSRDFWGLFRYSSWYRMSTLFRCLSFSRYSIEASTSRCGLAAIPRQHRFDSCYRQWSFKNVFYWQNTVQFCTDLDQRLL